MVWYYFGFHEYTSNMHHLIYRFIDKETGPSKEENYEVLYH